MLQVRHLRKTLADKRRTFSALHTNSEAAAETPAGVVASTAAFAALAAVPRVAIRESNASAKGLPETARASIAEAAIEKLGLVLICHGYQDTDTYLPWRY